MTNYKYALTENQITLTIDGKVLSVSRDDVRFNTIVAAAKAGKSLDGLLTIDGLLMTWSGGKFSAQGETVTFNGSALPASLGKRVLGAFAKGESPTRLLRFWEKIQTNPSMNSVMQAWDFLAHNSIQIGPTGNVLCFKHLTEDFKDNYTRKVDNRIGAIVHMPRNRISEDPKSHCSVGLHICARDYAAGHSTVVLVEAHPRDIVCIPNDYSAQKMRVCMYRVVGLDVKVNVDNITPHPDMEHPLSRDTRNLIEALGGVPGAMPNATGEAPAQGKAAVVKPISKDRVAERSFNDVVSERPVGFAKRKAQYKKLDRLMDDELLKMSSSALRDYAVHGLFLPGAAQIPGGKVTLVDVILQARHAYGLA